MQHLSIDLEAGLLWGGSALYLAAGLAHLHSSRSDRSSGALVLAPLVAGVVALAASIAIRWSRVGYGPFLTLHEVIVSNVFSIGLIYSLVYWRFPTIRPGALVALPLLLIFCTWAVVTPTSPSHLPPTFDNPWLWLHVGTGKVFLSTCLVSTSLAGLLLLRRLLPPGRASAGTEDMAGLDDAAWRFLSFAFVFHSMMLVTGAVWARDAWGRYWAWDPLETWAFVTWLAMAIILHGRVTFRLPPSAGWWGIWVVFALAVLTFFGVPFASTAPHKGVM